MAKFNVCLRMAFICTSAYPIVYTPKAGQASKSFSHYDVRWGKKVIRERHS
jgi:hypothetical protein